MFAGLKWVCLPPHLCSPATARTKSDEKKTCRGPSVEEHHFCSGWQGGESGEHQLFLKHLTDDALRVSDKNDEGEWCPGEGV